MYAWVLACMYIHCVHVWCLWRLEEVSDSLGTGLTGSCELHCRCLELNPGSLQEQPVFEPSLQTLVELLKKPLTYFPKCLHRFPFPPAMCARPGLAFGVVGSLNLDTLRVCSAPMRLRRPWDGRLDLGARWWHWWLQMLTIFFHRSFTTHMSSLVLSFKSFASFKA